MVWGMGGSPGMAWSGRKHEEPKADKASEQAKKTIPTKETIEADVRLATLMVQSTAKSIADRTGELGSVLHRLSTAKRLFEKVKFEGDKYIKPVELDMPDGTKLNMNSWVRYVHYCKEWMWKLGEGLKEAGAAPVEQGTAPAARARRMPVVYVPASAPEGLDANKDKVLVYTFQGKTGRRTISELENGKIYDYRYGREFDSIEKLIGYLGAEKGSQSVHELSEFRLVREPGLKPVVGEEAVKPVTDIGFEKKKLEPKTERRELPAYEPGRAAAEEKAEATVRTSLSTMTPLKDGKQAGKEAIGSLIPSGISDNVLNTAKSLYDERFMESWGMLQDGLKGIRMGPRIEYYCSMVALGIAREEGLVFLTTGGKLTLPEGKKEEGPWHFTADAKEKSATYKAIVESGQADRLQAIMHDGRLYSKHLVLDGRKVRVIDVLERIEQEVKQAKINEAPPQAEEAQAPRTRFGIGKPRVSEFGRMNRELRQRGAATPAEEGEAQVQAAPEAKPGTVTAPAPARVQPETAVHPFIAEIRKDYGSAAADIEQTASRIPTSEDYPVREEVLDIAAQYLAGRRELGGQITAENLKFIVPSAMFDLYIGPLISPESEIGKRVLALNQAELATLAAGAFEQLVGSGTYGAAEIANLTPEMASGIVESVLNQGKNVIYHSID